MSFKGLFLLFLPNVPGAILIQGNTFIPDSRVVSSPTNFSEVFFDFSVHMLEVGSQQPRSLI